ncbi:MAG TPA: C40 family peptidase [Segetibacter sp.]|nr:C40 family peptidase [Segetibacter sp.]
MKNALLIFILFTSCKQPGTEEVSVKPVEGTTQRTASKVAYIGERREIQTGNTTPQELLAFAKTLIGIPYKYGSTDPRQGFDCSGFITYVFNHFNIVVPRSSVDFTNVEREIALEEAQPGDIILFTGTDYTTGVVGHMGIITSTDNKDYQFIHSSSGKGRGVIITRLNEYFMKRLVKVIRVFRRNNINGKQ